MTVQEWLGNDNQLGIDIWERKYRYENESFDEWLDRVSGGNDDVRKLIQEKKFLFGGRTLSNRGTDKKGSLSNCYSRGFVHDDLDDIMQASTDIAKTFKSQGGQGVSLSKLRPKGCGINNGQFQSDGIVPFMEIYNRITESISQGGCIAENELIQTSNGYKRMKDVGIGDKVWTKVGFVEVTDKFDKGLQQTYRVVTKKGYEITTTIDHKFAIDGFEKTPLSNLKCGDSINLIAGHCAKQNSEFIPIAYFIGSYLANGYINQNGNGGNISVGLNHKDVAYKVKECIENLGFECRINEEGNVYRVYLNKKLCEYIKKELRVHKNGANDIVIPEFIMTGNDDTVLSFLAGILDNDGTIRNNSFKYSTVCKKYANQVIQLFSRVGYFPSMRVTVRDGKQDLYDVADSFRTGCIQIPSLKINKANIEFTKNSRYSTPYTKNNSGLTSKDGEHLGKISGDQKIGLYTYLQVDNPPFTPIIYDEISEIVDVGVQHVYDIELEKEHLFNCNGIYVSNSRKGALIMTLDAWHKEAQNFITIKSEEGRIQKANLSLEIDDEFMEDVEKYYETGEVITKHIVREYEGNKVEYDVTPIELYKLMMQKAYDWAEPGCIYTNRFRNYNLMEYDNEYCIETCNPCGKKSLPHVKNSVKSVKPKS